MSQGQPHTGRDVFLLGALPPPVHGLAAVNLFVLEELRQRGYSVEQCSLAPPTLARNWQAHFTKFRHALRGLRRYLGFAKRHPHHCLYVGLSGGWGQVYELPFVFFARRAKATIVVHHHSFAYIDRRSRLTAALIRAGGTLLSHNVLSERMGELLQGQYGKVPYVAISNARTIQAKPGRTVRTRVARVGFLSNICLEKGIAEFLAVAERFPQVEFTIAGPFVGSEDEAFVRGRLSALPNVRHLGPVSGARKWEFFDGIDVLLFPTKYRNEAEPLVILEAFACGIPVIAHGRGCIPDIVRGGAGLVVPVDQEFVVAASAQLQQWSSDEGALAEASHSSLRQFEALKAGPAYVPG